jgi:hypothetical protein
MNPFERFCNGIKHVQHEFNGEMNEMLAFAEIMARKSNAVELDENGTFYVVATGSLEEVIPTLMKQLEKLQRIKNQKDNTH